MPYNWNLKGIKILMEKSAIEGKVILITGATDGIGKQTALELAQMGAQILVHGRDLEKTATTCEELKLQTDNDAIFGYIADFADFNQVRKLVREITNRFNHLDVLVNNAGTYFNQRLLSAQGFELNLAIGHLAPFLLTNLLLELLKNSPSGRIVTVSSSAHGSAVVDFENLQGEKQFDGWQAYCLAKLGNLFMAFELANRLQDTQVTSNALHPGTIDTKLYRSTGFTYNSRSVVDGAATSVYLASDPEVQGINGQYFVKRKVVTPAAIAQDKDLRVSFWEHSEILCGRK